MEEEQVYVVKITPEAEQHYFDLSKYFYSSHSVESAFEKSEEILIMAMSLEKMPYRGSSEKLLSYLKKSHKYLVYKSTSRKTVKIIYFIEESTKTVYVTDFFPTEMGADEITSRSKVG